MSAVSKDEEHARAAAPVGDKPPSPGSGEASAPADVKEGTTAADDPPLPDEDAPPLPQEPPPDPNDDGWTGFWNVESGAFQYYNRFTGVLQWENPRVPEATAYSYAPYDRNPTSVASAAYTTSSGAPGTSSPPKRKWGGYNPAIHGSYDPNADYAREASKEEEEEEQAAAAARLPIVPDYTSQARFNRFNGKHQQDGVGPEMHNDENKSKRQMTAFFDVDAAANSHDGRSLKAERRGKTLSKKELKAFKEKRHSKKEEKRRAWLRD